MTSPRDHALDGLRGIAALCVVLSHVAAMTWNPFYDHCAPTWWEYSLWHLGAPSVDLFFVLSGYVVARSLLRTRQAYGGYLLGRAIRLYPIAWIGVVAGLILRMSKLHPNGDMSTSLALLGEPLSFQDIIGFTTLIAPIPTANDLNPPLWTIVVEITAALAMPALAIVARRRPLVLAVTGVAALTALGLAIDRVYPLEFCGFLVGAALAAAERRIPRAPRPATLLVAGLALLLSRHVIGTDSELMRPITPAGAALVILAIRQGALRDALNGALARRAGRISYPLYAVHWPIMATATMTLGPSIGPTAAAIAAIPFALAAAWGLERTVDTPAVMLSHMVKSRRP